jgi:hypothetical protein
VATSAKLAKKKNRERAERNVGRANAVAVLTFLCALCRLFALSDVDEALEGRIVFKPAT